MPPQKAEVQAGLCEPSRVLKGTCAESSYTRCLPALEVCLGNDASHSVHSLGCALYLVRQVPVEFKDAQALAHAAQLRDVL